MDLGKMFTDAMGSVAAFFFGAPTHAETPIVRPPQISPVIAQDWRDDVPEYAQCAVNVARNFMSPNDPDAISISTLHNDGMHSTFLSRHANGVYEEIGFEWGATKDGRQTDPGWSLTHNWDKSTGRGTSAGTMTGYYETGNVTGYLGGALGELFNPQAQKLTYSFSDNQRQWQDVRPVAVPHLFNAIKSTCNILG